MSSTNGNGHGNGQLRAFAERAATDAIAQLVWRGAVLIGVGLIAWNLRATIGLDKSVAQMATTLASTVAAVADHEQRLRDLDARTDVNDRRLDGVEGPGGGQ